MKSLFVRLLLSAVLLLSADGAVAQKAYCSECLAVWGSCSHSRGGGNEAPRPRGRSDVWQGPSAEELARQREEARKREEEHARAVRKAQAIALNDQGVEREKAGDLEGAIAYYNAAKKLDPADKTIGDNFLNATRRLENQRETAERRQRDEAMAKDIRDGIARLVDSLPSLASPQGLFSGDETLGNVGGNKVRTLAFGQSKALDELIAAEAHARTASQGFGGNSTLFGPGNSGQPDTGFGGSTLFGQQPMRTTRSALNDPQAQAHKSAGQLWDTKGSFSGSIQEVFAGGSQQLALPAYLESAPASVKNDPQFQSLLKQRQAKVARVDAIRQEVREIDSAYPRAKVEEKPLLEQRKQQFYGEGEKLLQGIKLDQKELDGVFIEKLTPTIRKRTQRPEPPPPGK